MSDMQQERPGYVKDLVLLFTIPIGIAILAAAAVYVPRILAQPKTDFIYARCSYDCSGAGVDVDSTGHVVVSDGFEDDFLPTPTLHYYDAKDDMTRSLSFDESQRYRLNTSSKSPDGYNLVRESGGGGFLFWDEDSSGWLLKNGMKNRKLELDGGALRYSGDVKFLGWVE